MNTKFGSSSSTCGNVNDVVGGRKTIESIGTNREDAVLVSVNDDAVVFSDEVESVPSLESDDEVFSSEEEESEEEWESDEEEEEDEEDAELEEGLAERLRILADARALKTLAVAFLHPEKPVEVTDATVYGRNYFARPSAPEQEEDEDADERAQILEDMMELKKAARAYLHPEDPVESAPEVFGRNYFHRAGAPEGEDVFEAEEHARVLAEAAALKKSAVDYMHPEIGVKSTSGECFGRNYFNRPSAPATEEDEYADERAEILAEMAALKQSAVDYMHPEIGVKTTDATLFGRNYFNRASAPDMEDAAEAEEGARILAEAKALKQSAVDYMHPEIGVTSASPECFGRNYFNRPSAPATEEDEYADERAEILAEMAALKQSAVDYLHPEIGVKTIDATLFGRNYFNRASAPDMEDACDANERAAILAEAKALKQSAVNYMHPEIGVTSASPECFGRNYFNRASAPETEEDEFADERAEILAEMTALKQSAVDYLHPEIGVKTTDATLFGRNYFNRPSAPDMEDASDAIEAARVLADAAALKKAAVDYMHPEIGVETTDATLFGRNYFNRASAPEQEDREIDEERACVLAEAASLKKFAVDYLHPERPVESSPECFGRNYFSRPSAPEQEDVSDADERAAILAEAASLKKSAIDYLHPEKPVEVSPECFGRNYFTRYSSPLEYEHEIIAYKEVEESQEIVAVKNLAAAVKGANLPSTKTVKTSSADMDVNPAKKSASSVNMFGLSEEVM